MLIALKAGFEPMWLVMIQSQAADVGSALTPIGNPQNLFLFEKYQVPVGEFVTFLLPFTIFGVCWTLVMNLLNSRKKASFTVEPSKIREPRKLMIFALAFLVVMLSVFRVIDYRIGLVLTFVVTMVLDRGFFKKIDYFLLGTFAFFFIFIDNMTRTEFISGLMRSVANGDMQTMVNSALFSQIISNVPSAILFSSFTDSYKGLTLGVNIGGSGTIIASLANLIAYRIYVKERGQNGKYLIIFMVSSTVSLLLSLTFGYFRLKFLGL
jgi:Na+/H+ antiporter NhaD/arsenite permease-like protein